MGRKQVEKKPTAATATAGSADDVLGPDSSRKSTSKKSWWTSKNLYKPGFNLRTAVGITAVSSAFTFANRGLEKYTMLEHIIAVLITMILSIVVGASPGVKDLAAFLGGEIEVFKEKKAFAGLVLILVPMYCTFGLYGPNGIATFVSMVIGFLTFTSK